MCYDEREGVFWRVGVECGGRLHWSGELFSHLYFILLLHLYLCGFGWGAVLLLSNSANRKYGNLDSWCDVCAHCCCDWSEE